MSGRFVPWAEANVHVLTHGLHYGTGVFDSIRAYATASGPALVHHLAHHERLRDSAALYGMDLGFTPSELVDATRTLVAGSGLDRVLRPHDRVPRRGRDGRLAERGAGRGRDRGLGLGRLPRRRRADARHPREDLLLAADRPHDPPAGREGHRPLHQLGAGAGRGGAARLRRGDPARRRRPARRGLGREPLPRQGRRAADAAAGERRARRHHAPGGAGAGRRVGDPRRRAVADARRAVPRRRAVHDRHRRRDHARARGRPAPDRRRHARPADGADPVGVPGRRARRGPALRALARRRRELVS